jgi:hypothetical protein
MWRSSGVYVCSNTEINKPLSVRLFDSGTYRTDLLTIEHGRGGGGEGAVRHLANRPNATTVFSIAVLTAFVNGSKRTYINIQLRSTYVTSH